MSQMVSNQWTRASLSKQSHDDETGETLGNDESDLYALKKAEVRAKV